MKKVMYAVAMAVGLTVIQTANAVTIQLASGPLSGSSIITFDTAMPSDVSLGITPDAALVTGSQSGLYATPFGDATKYATTGAAIGIHPNAKIELTFANSINYLGLLWGSVDTYNTLTLLNSGGQVVSTITGSQILANATGDQGINGTKYVNITGFSGVSKVVFTSSQYAFEFDNVAYNVPDSATTMMLLGSSLFGIGALRRRYSR